MCSGGALIHFLGFHHLNKFKAMFYSLFGEKSNLMRISFRSAEATNKKDHSGQIIATSHDLTPNGALVREISLFQGNLGW